MTLRWGEVVSVFSFASPSVCFFLFFSFLELHRPDTGLGAPDLQQLLFTQKQLKALDLIYDIYTFKFTFKLGYFCFLYILTLIGQIS